MNHSNVILYLLPELIVLFAAIVVLMLGLSKKANANIIFYTTQLAVVAAFVITALSQPDAKYAFFYNQFIVDPLASLLKAVILVIVFFVFIYGRHYIRDRSIQIAEFYALALLSVFGMMILVSTANLISLYLALECLSLPIYAMVALERKRVECVEAAMKYFVTGAFASGLFLYGMSMLFGATGSLDIPLIAHYAVNMGGNHILLLSFGLVFALAGMLFKLGIAPFHMWVPDVYEGSPSNVTLFLSSAPKIAAFALLVRLLVFALPSLSIEWHDAILIAALLSIALGNILAIVQENIKRLLAYSSIAHMGYAMLAFSVATAYGEEAALFYLIAYSIMTVGAFGMIVLLSNSGFEVENISDLAGLNTRNSWLAFLMLLIMFSMAGVPPIIGFIAKMRILEALMRAHFVWAAVYALVFAIIGAYYYLRVVKIMYFEEPRREIKTYYTKPQAIALGVNSLAVLVLGIYPVPLFHLCQIAFMTH
jgi:NADH-quinone oxidoreductase subunit N